MEEWIRNNIPQGRLKRIEENKKESSEDEESGSGSGSGSSYDSESGESG